MYMYSNLNKILFTLKIDHNYVTVLLKKIKKKTFNFVEKSTLEFSKLLNYFLSFLNISVCERNSFKKYSTLIL